MSGVAPDPLDRIERLVKGAEALGDPQYIAPSDVLALVEVARAAREAIDRADQLHLIGFGPLRAALARLDKGAAPKQVERDPHSGRWYRLGPTGERLHGPYLSEQEARPVIQCDHGSHWGTCPECRRIYDL